MANSKISDLTLVTALDGNDVLPIVNGGSTKKVTVTKIKEGLATTTYVDTQDALKVDKVAGKGLSTEDYTSAEKTKLGGIATGAEVNVNADWNASSGDAQILNKPTIPTATNQLTNNGSNGVNPFITALDIPVGSEASTLVLEVKNMTGATLTKGTVIYISGANGNKALVSKALATTDALSSRTFGMLQSDILNNGLGNCVIIGNLSGLNTSSFTEGDQLYLSGVTAGAYTASKILAPTHLVYVGKVTRSHPTLGEIEVGIQNGYELEEIHDVQITTPLNNDSLFYETSTDLWKNKSIATVLGYTPAPIASPTFEGTVVLPSTTSIGNVTNTEIGYLDGVTSAIQTQIDGKLTTTTWQDFTSTQVGWSTTSTFLVRYMVISKMVTVYFRISGTSNSTTTTITMPFTNNGTSNISILSAGLNVGGAVIANSAIATGGNILSATYFSAITAQSSFTASGTKQIAGTITYEIP